MKRIAEITVPPTLGEELGAYSSYLFNRPSMSHIVFGAEDTKYTPAQDRVLRVPVDDEFENLSDDEVIEKMHPRYPECRIEILPVEGKE